TLRATLSGRDCHALRRGMRHLKQKACRAGLTFFFTVAACACQRPPASQTVHPAPVAATSPQHAAGTATPRENEAGPSRDLSIDESMGGHTLERHVGRTDAELRDRLRREPDISTASTYEDRVTAERVVGAALASNNRKLEAWLKRQG